MVGRLPLREDGLLLREPERVYETSTSSSRGRKNVHVFHSELPAHLCFADFDRKPPPPPPESLPGPRRFKGSGPGPLGRRDCFWARGGGTEAPTAAAQTSKNPPLLALRPRRKPFLCRHKTQKSKKMDKTDHTEIKNKTNKPKYK